MNLIDAMCHLKNNCILIANNKDDELYLYKLERWKPNPMVLEKKYNIKMDWQMCELKYNDLAAFDFIIYEKQK